MKKEVKILFYIFALFLLFPTSAYAAGGAGIGTLIYPVINFSLYSAIIFWVYRRFIAPMLKARHESVKHALTNAAGSIREAEAELSSLSDRYSRISEEKGRLLDEFSQQAEKLAESAIIAAQDSAKALRQDAERRVEREHLAAESEVRALVVQRATELARKQLAERLSAEEDRKVRSQVIRGMFS